MARTLKAQIRAMAERANREKAKGLRRGESREYFGMTPTYGSAKQYSTKVHYITDGNGQVIGATGATLTRLGKTPMDIKEQNDQEKASMNGFTMPRYNPYER